MPSASTQTEQPVTLAQAADDLEARASQSEAGELSGYSDMDAAADDEDSAAEVADRTNRSPSEPESQV